MLSGLGLSLFTYGGAPADLGVATFRLLTAFSFLILLSLGSYQYLEVPARRFLRKVLAGTRPTIEPILRPAVDSPAIGAKIAVIRTGV
jgi:peptidoglycan/LPS O-acetylase OafA/YrhL